MMRDDGDRQQGGRAQRMEEVVAPRGDEQRERCKDNSEQHRDGNRASDPVDACRHLQRRHAGVMHRRHPGADDGTAEHDPRGARGRYRDAQPHERHGDREDQRKDRYRDVVGAGAARPVGEHRDEMRRPDAASADGGIQGDSDQTPGAVRRARPVKQTDRRRACEQAHRAAKRDQSPVVLLGETVENLIHCGPLSTRT
ncbi:hypothetical protein ACVWW4_008144 [Bradyrhizobium sp. LB7.1]